MFNKIFVPYDLSEPSKIALEWAIIIGGALHSAVKVMHILPDYQYLYLNDLNGQKEEINKHLKEEIEKNIRTFSTQRETPEKIETKVIWGTVTVQLLENIHEYNAELVVVGTHGRTGWKRIPLGSTAENIARYSAVPVLTAKTKPSWPPKRILIPVDFSDYAEEAVWFGTEFAKNFDSELHLIHVATLPEIVPALHSVYGPIPDREVLEKEGRKKINALAEKHAGTKIKTHCAAGETVPVIAERAKELQADLILMPTHGRTGLSHLLMGSIAEQVLRYAETNVLTFCPKHYVQRKKEKIAQLGLAM